MSRSFSVRVVDHSEAVQPDSLLPALLSISVRIVTGVHLPHLFSSLLTSNFLSLSSVALSAQTKQTLT
jgi:hypothetical protein